MNVNVRLWDVFCATKEDGNTSGSFDVTLKQRQKKNFIFPAEGTKV